ncbi:uncharacterized protein [Rutidosis leptorrhynchoides]|uniref:uncharacterized protein isoform X2 n=1 Tax=Rutidosis leptorrhynchoides TaxID=125765 RepID=UPI003A995070
MASGSSKGYDFASDDILCSYEDYTNQETSNGSHSDSAITANSNKEFNKNRMARTSVFPASSYNPPDDSCNKEVIILAVERSMKKYTDNLMRFLEGLSSRLSQLELYCYNLDKSIGEMRSDLTRDHEESDAKLKFLEKHVQEVHRSVQILRDKQELADTQKELAKLQLAQKESSSSNNSQQKVDRPLTPDTKENDNSGLQLALALPGQFAPPQQQRITQTMSQPQAYYLPPHGPPQHNPNQYSQSQVPPPQPQQLQQQLPPQQLQQQQQPPPQPQLQQQPPPQPQPQIQSMPPYPQQWASQVQPQQSRPSSPQVYPQYPEQIPNSMPMHMPYSSGLPSASTQPPTYTYGAPARTAPPQQPPPQQPQPQHLKPAYGQPGDGYAPSGPPQGNTYMMYDNQAGHGHFSQGSYPPNPQQTGAAGTAGGGGMMSRPVPQFMRNHPYSELIDKLVSMGYRSDHVMSVIQRLDETGQAVDFNAVLDRLNGHAPTGSQRGWSG